MKYALASILLHTNRIIPINLSCIKLFGTIKHCPSFRMDISFDMNLCAAFMSSSLHVLLPGFDP